MTRIAKALLIFCLFFYGIQAVYAQTTSSFMVNGDLDKYYPVTFFDGGWADNVATELEIGRSFLHLDGNVRGAMIAKFRFHVTNWGHGSEFIDADIRQYTNVNNKLIGGWQDGTLHNGSYTIIIWLRGNTSYFYRSNYAVNPKVYDGVQNALPYQEVNGPAHSYKASIDPYVNSIGMSYSNTAYFNGSGVNYYAGSLGIGTTTPGAYKLAVKGTIGAQAPAGYPGCCGSGKGRAGFGGDGQEAAAEDRGANPLFNRTE